MAKRCAIVTGGNKGIGFECVRQLQAELPEDFDVVLTSRSVDLGEASAAELTAAAGASGGIVYHQCDIESEESVEGLRSWAEAKYGGVDLLVNNAGFAFQGKSEDVPFSEQASTTVGINYFGTLRLTNALIPLLRPHARVVNVASMSGMGALYGLDDEKLVRVRDPAMTEEQISAFMTEFIDAAAKGGVKSQGWPENSYGMSKLGVYAMTRLHAQHPHVVFHDVSVNSCCPGWCMSEMSATIAANNDTSFAKSAAQGADTVCWIATLPRAGGGSPDEPPSGAFVRPRQLITDGGPQERWEEWTFMSVSTYSSLPEL